jgi:hypothetical protein
MQLNLYNILNIPEHIILENNIHTILQNETLENLNQAVSIVNKFHSYFHFEQSFAYLLAAYIAHLKKDEHSRKDYLTKAIFQDHINEQALNFHDNASLSYIFSYNKNIRYEKDFLQFSIGKFTPSSEVELLDNAIEFSISSKIVDTEIIPCSIANDHVVELHDLHCAPINYRLALLDACSPSIHLALKNGINYKSHRLDCVKTIIAIYNRELDLANIFIQNGIDSIEASHKNYHQFASSVYLKRAAIFESQGQIDLAKNDRVKAGDLFPV